VYVHAYVKKSSVNGGIFDIDILIYFEKTQTYLNFMIIFFLLHCDFCFVVVLKKASIDVLRLVVSQNGSIVE